MNIRNLQLEDLPEIERLYRQFFTIDFHEPPDFSMLQFPVVVEDSSGDVMMAGAIKPFAEMIVVANKSLPLVARRKAYFTLLQAMAFGSQKLGYDHLHAFASTKRWEAALKLAGFKECKGTALYIGVKADG